MIDLLGVAVSAAGGIIFYGLAAYIFIKAREKNPSHYLFIFVAICIGTSDFLASLEFVAPPKFGVIFLRFDLSLLAFAMYFLLCFTYYLRKGPEIDTMVSLVFPTLFIVGLVFLYLVKGMQLTYYGWVGVYEPISSLIYDVYGLVYLTWSFMNLLFLYCEISGDLRNKIKKFIIGLLIVIVVGSINSALVYVNVRLCPLLEIATAIMGVIYTIALTSGSESE